MKPQKPQVRVSCWFLPATTYSLGSQNPLDYLTAIMDRKIKRVLNSELNNIKLRSCFMQRALVAKVFEFSKEPAFLISQGGFHSSNIIIDNNFYITE